MKLPILTVAVLSIFFAAMTSLRAEDASLCIEVVDREGKPQAGRKFELYIYPRLQDLPKIGDGIPTQLVKLTTDRDGKAFVQNLAPGRRIITTMSNFGFGEVEWVVSFAGPELGSDTSFVLKPGENLIRLIRARETSSITAQIISATSGEPIPGASATLLSRAISNLSGGGFGGLGGMGPYEQYSYELTADDNGKIKIEKFTPGPYRIKAWHPGFEPAYSARFWITKEGEFELPEPIRLTPSKNVGAIRFQILLSAGQPDSDADVRVTARRIPDEVEKLERSDWWAEALSPYYEPKRRTDKEGFVVIQDVPPGIYDLIIEPSQRPTNLCGVYVKAGMTTEGGSVRTANDLNGLITGRVRGASERVQQELSVHAWNIDTAARAAFAEDLKLHGDRFALFQRGGLYGYGMYSSGQVKGGVYEIDHLKPGNYAMCLYLGQLPFRFISNVLVQDEKTVEAPEIVVSGLFKDPQVIKGIVKLPDGRPARDAYVSVDYYGSEVRGTKEDGRFTITGYLTENRGIERLKASVHGYPRKFVDLTRPGIDLENLEVALDEQHHGNLRVVATGPEGKPLVGAIISIISADRNRHLASRIADASGVAVFRGLATGSRRIDAGIEGYYLPRPADVEIKRDAETVLAIALHPALTLRGKVELPKGCDVTKTIVYLCSRSDMPIYRISAVDAAGHYEFTGLPPDEYGVLPQYPGLISLTPSKFHVSESRQQYDLKLVQPGALHFDIGVDLSYSRVQLIECGAWDPARVAFASGLDYYEYLFGDYFYWKSPWEANDEGRLAVFGMVPGTYDMLITPQFKGALPPRTFNATRVFQNAQIFSLPRGIDDFPKLEAARFALPRAEGRVSGRLMLQYADVSKEILRELSIKLVGERAVASFEFLHFQLYELPSTTQAQPSSSFSVLGLPAGAYRLYVGPKYTSEPHPEWNLLLRRFILADGESLDLGNVSVDLPDSLWRCLISMKAQERAEYDAQWGYNDKLKE